MKEQCGYIVGGLQPSLHNDFKPAYSMHALITRLFVRVYNKLRENSFIICTVIEIPVCVIIPMSIYNL